VDDVDRGRLDMGRIVAAVQLRLADLLDEYQATVRVLDANTWPAARGYEPWVEEVWVNYLSNASKYGGRPPCVEVGADRAAEGQVRFWVRDNGPGLSREEQARLFVPFRRLAQVRAEGYGLGLSIVQRIVAKLGGQVGLESRPGEGSTFWFTLPEALEVRERV
jgi:signal transduction histidine kinase